MRKRSNRIGGMSMWLGEMRLRNVLECLGVSVLLLLSFILGIRLEPVLLAGPGNHTVVLGAIRLDGSGHVRVVVGVEFAPGC